MTLYRKRIKLFLGHLANKNKKTIYILSMGRSGSKLVHSLIINEMFSNKLLGVLNSTFISDLHSRPFYDGQVIKSHCCFDERFYDEKSVYLYVYGDIVDCVISNHLKFKSDKTWKRNHLRNFANVKHEISDDAILSSDILSLTENFISWKIAATRYTNIALINFESLFSDTTRISELTGLNIPVPEKRARKIEKFRQDYDVDSIRLAYKKLDRLIKNE